MWRLIEGTESIGRYIFAKTLGKARFAAATADIVKTAARLETEEISAVYVNLPLACPGYGEPFLLAFPPLTFCY